MDLTCIEKGYKEEGTLGSIRRATIKEALERTKKQIEEQLADINKALALMNENPKLVEMLEAIQKARY